MGLKGGVSLRPGTNTITFPPILLLEHVVSRHDNACKLFKKSEGILLLLLVLLLMHALCMCFVLCSKQNLNLGPKKSIFFISFTEVVLFLIYSELYSKDGDWDDGGVGGPWMLEGDREAHQWWRDPNISYPIPRTHEWWSTPAERRSHIS